MASHSEELAVHLLDSGARALEHASTLVESEPEVSIITFAVGLELSLKARLAFEHWYLIVEGRNNSPANCWTKLREGGLRTLGATAVESVLASLMPQEEGRVFARSRTALGAVKEKRDRAVHFGLAPDEKENSPAALAAAQLQAWHALRAWAEEWPEALRVVASERWGRIDAALEKLDGFLDAKATELRPRLKELQEQGAAVGLCVKCEHIGLVRQKGDLIGGPASTGCEVCLQESLAVTGPCPRCKKTVAAALDAHSQVLKLACVSCGESSEEDTLGVVQVVAHKPDPHDPGPNPEAPMCGSCADGNRVVQLYVEGKELLVCPECSSRWEEGWEAVGNCEHCGEEWVGADLEGSGFLGCDMCRDAARERFDRS
jgi:hypothetical protein